MLEIEVLQFAIEKLMFGRKLRIPYSFVFAVKMEKIHNIISFKLSVVPIVFVGLAKKISPTNNIGKLYAGSIQGSDVAPHVSSKSSSARSESLGLSDQLITINIDVRPKRFVMLCDVE